MNCYNIVNILSAIYNDDILSGHEVLENLQHLWDTIITFLLGCNADYDPI